MDKAILIFIVIQFVNIILSTFKTVFLIKSNKTTAAIVNAIAYTVGVFVIKYVSDIPLIWSAPLTFVLNLLGIYLGLAIIEKTRKNELWRISTTINKEQTKEYIKKLRETGVQIMPYRTENEGFDVVDIFSNNKAETKKIKPILKEFDVKYTILASNHSI